MPRAVMFRVVVLPHRVLLAQASVQVEFNAATRREVSVVGRPG